jgi:hypothetical protein
MMQPGAGILLLGLAVCGFTWSNHAFAQDRPLENWSEAGKEAKEEARRETERKQSEADAKWLQDNAEYFRQLCSAPAGEAHEQAWNEHGFAVSTDEDRARQAKKARKKLVDCTRVPEPKPAE